MPSRSHVQSINNKLFINYIRARWKLFEALWRDRRRRIVHTYFSVCVSHSLHNACENRPNGAKFFQKCQNPSRMNHRLMLSMRCCGVFWSKQTLTIPQAPLPLSQHDLKWDDGEKNAKLWWKHVKHIYVNVYSLTQRIRIECLKKIMV